MLQRISIMVTIGLMAALAPLIGASPASAVTIVSITANDVTVKNNNCKTARVEVDGDWNADAHNDISVDISNSHGNTVRSAFFTDDVDGSVATSVNLCGGDDPTGKYHVDVVVNGYDINGSPTSSVSESASFQFHRTIPKAYSHMAFGKKYRAGKRFPWIAVGKLTRKGHAYGGKRVEAQAKVDGTWYVIDRTRTNRRGLFGWEFKPNRFQWRYVYYGDRTTWGSYVKFRLPARHHARTVVSGDPQDFIKQS